MLIKETEKMTSSERMAARNSNSLFLQALFSEAADYPIEIGEKDGWTYEKWNSGVAKCYGKVLYGFKGTGPHGALFAEVALINLPAGVFNAKPMYVFCDFDLVGSVGAKLWTPNNSKDTIEVIISTSLEYGVGSQCTIAIKAVGRWK